MDTNVDDDVYVDVDLKAMSLKKTKEQTNMKIRSGCAIGPSLSRGKEALNDQSVNKARATRSCRGSSIAREAAGQVGEERN